MADAKLKPCPFCGGPAKVWQQGIYFSAGCKSFCAVAPRTSDDEDRERTIETWNRRTRRTTR